jgi:uncharacterized membrane-anchored protein
MIEVLITAVVIGFAVYIIFNNFKKKKNRSCGCGNCSK